MQRDPKFDRVSRPDPRRARPRDDAGKEALYSTSPEAPTGGLVNVECRRCTSRSALSTREALRLLRSPVVFNPLKPSAPVWARCPSCGRRSWLHVEPGDSIKGFLRGDER